MKEDGLVCTVSDNYSSSVTHYNWLCSPRKIHLNVKRVNTPLEILSIMLVREAGKRKIHFYYGCLGTKDSIELWQKTQRIVNVQLIKPV